jgi:hypothetical protein
MIALNGAFKTRESCDRTAGWSAFGVESRTESAPTGAECAGSMSDGRLPIILTSRADGVMTWLASCVVAALVAVHRQNEIAGAIPAPGPRRRHGY